jgi:hypothetical protein
MIVLTPMASPVSRSETAVTMRLGIAAKAAPEPALTRQLQRTTKPTESCAVARPTSAPAMMRQPAKNGALEPLRSPILPTSGATRSEASPAGRRAIGGRLLLSGYS